MKIGEKILKQFSFELINKFEKKDGAKSISQNF